MLAVLAWHESEFAGCVDLAAFPSQRKPPRDTDGGHRAGQGDRAVTVPSANFRFQSGRLAIRQGASADTVLIAHPAAASLPAPPFRRSSGRGIGVGLSGLQTDCETDAHLVTAEHFAVLIVLSTTFRAAVASLSDPGRGEAGMGVLRRGDVVPTAPNPLRGHVCRRGWSCSARLLCRASGPRQPPRGLPAGRGEDCRIVNFAQGA